MITISIDVTLLDKTRFKEITRKNGKKAVFCDLVLFETPDGQYGDYIVKQSQTPEERQARVQAPILGNGKKMHKSGAKPESTPTENQSTSNNSDDVPF